jgi:general secretion pathway protein D
VVTRLVNLKFVSAEDVQQILSQLISAEGLINAYTGTNSLIIIDSEDNIERLVSIVAELDVPFSNREMTIIPVQHADVEDVAEKLNEILGEGGKKAGEGAAGSVDLLRARMAIDPAQAFGAPTGLVPPAGGAPRPPGSGGKTVAARGMEPKMIPDQRTNSIIVVADEDTTARVRALISQLDSKIDLSGNKFYVYRCQHANAEELAQVLSGLAGSGGLGGGTGAPGATNPRGASGGLSGLFDDGTGSGGTGNRSGGRSSLGQNAGGGGLGGTGAARTGAGGGRRSGGGNANTGPINAQIGENISVTADPATNSLIIAASKVDYEKIKALLGQLDVKRRQVLVEATLLEVSVDNTLRTSAEFLTSTGGSDGGVFAQSRFAGENASLGSLFSNPSRLQGFTLAAASAGSLKLPGGLTIPTQSFLVSAAAANNNVNVLSAPTILATDNEEAQIVVGQNVPFLASTSTNQANLNNTFNQVDRQDVGITLRITPQISSRDYVTLQIFTEVSAIVLSTVNSPLGPTTNKRQSETTIISKDGQMIVTGGLISDDVSETDEGVPFLKEIPILGQAFKSNSQARSQKNLLIFLTPRIVKDQFDARDTTLESRERMEDVIASYGVEPRREQFLHREAIDNIAESEPYEGVKPGTITAPRKVQDAAINQRNRPAAGSTEVLDGSSEGVLDLDSGTSPKLPSVTDSDDEVVLDEGSMRQETAVLGSLKRPAAGAVTSTSPGQFADQFIVLQLARKEDSQKKLPFLLGNNSKMVGIVLPKESANTAKSFFQIGKPYTYIWNNERIPVQTVGAFGSIIEASKVHPGLPGAWYTLSPYEIMNLGKGPWAAAR